MSLFIVIGTRLCNLENIDDISYEFFQDKKISLSLSNEPIRIVWNIIIMYKSGNVVTENIVDDSFSTEEERSALDNIFQEKWIDLMTYLSSMGDCEEEEEEKNET